MEGACGKTRIGNKVGGVLGRHEEIFETNVDGKADQNRKESVNRGKISNVGEKGVCHHRRDTRTGTTPNLRGETSQKRGGPPDNTRPKERDSFGSRSDL